MSLRGSGGGGGGGDHFDFNLQTEESKLLLYKRTLQGLKQVKDLMELSQGFKGEGSQIVR